MRCFSLIIIVLPSMWLIKTYFYALGMTFCKDKKKSKFQNDRFIIYLWQSKTTSISKGIMSPNREHCSRGDRQDQMDCTSDKSTEKFSHGKAIACWLALTTYGMINDQ